MADQCPFCGSTLKLDGRYFRMFRCGTDIWKPAGCDPGRNLIRERSQLCIRRTLIRHALRYRAQRDAAVASLMSVVRLQDTTRAENQWLHSLIAEAMDALRKTEC